MLQVTVLQTTRVTNSGHTCFADVTTQGARAWSALFDELIDGHLSLQLDHSPLSPNSSAPPGLLRRDDDDDADDGVSDGQSSRCSVSSVAAAATDPSAFDVVDAVERASQCSAAAGDRPVSLVVVDAGPPRRPKAERRRKPCIGQVVWNLYHEAELARKVGVLCWLSAEFLC